MSESISEADSDTDMGFFGTSDTGLDTHMYLGRVHGQTSDARVRSSMVHVKRSSREANSHRLNS